MQELSQEDQIRRGQAAEGLMQYPAFTDLFDLIVDDMSRQIVATAPKDHEVRKELYYTVHGMRSFLGVLNSYVSAADAIVAKLNLDNTESTTEPY